MKILSMARIYGVKGLKIRGKLIAFDSKDDKATIELEKGYFTTSSDNLIPIGSFSSNICERCGEESCYRTMSVFNTDICCDKCIDKESSHKLYKIAKNAERSEVANGNRNFEGIGLPPDLVPVKHGDMSIEEYLKLMKVAEGLND